MFELFDQFLLPNTNKCLSMNVQTSSNPSQNPTKKKKENPSKHVTNERKIPWKPWIYKQTLFKPCPSQTTADGKWSIRGIGRLLWSVLKREEKSRRRVHRCHDRGSSAVYTPLIVRQVCVHSECNISWPTRGGHMPPSVCFGLHCRHGYVARRCGPLQKWEERRWSSLFIIPRPFE